MITVTRITTAAELEPILALDEACFHRPWTRADYERELTEPARAYLFAAKIDGATVAYCSFWRIFDEIHVNNFAVHPAWRRRGVGRALLSQVLVTATDLGAPNVTLEVRASNTAAIAMYTAAGFTTGGRRHAYYTHPVEDALILWCRATPA